MRLELSEEFGVQKSHVTVVPFGINNAVPNTSLTPAEAKQRLRIQEHEKTLLFFGNIAPYKGLEHLVDAFRKVLRRDKGYRLIIAGRPKDCEKYWDGIQASIQSDLQTGKIHLKAEYIPDAETEVYFKGSDVLVLPYTHVYQSGVLFLAHSFGLPVLAADVGCLGDEIVEGKNGFVFKARNSVDLAGTVERYFSSNLYTHLDQQRDEIRRCAAQQHSWEIVGRITMEVYGGLLGFAKRNETQNF
jgi:glycosyltransferase involved in cell wall biosynthesis